MSEVPLYCLPACFTSLVIRTPENRTRKDCSLGENLY